MYGNNFRAPKVDVHAFSMIPRADIPRSSFRMQHQHKTTASASVLYPMYLQEILPGDSFKCNMSCFARMATPIVPIMDNMDVETWFFFVPNRLTWKNWIRFQGEQDNPTDSIVFTVPQVVSPVGGFIVNSIYDHFGLPCVGQIAAGNTISINALPLRAYNLIYNQWFRDENLSFSQLVGNVPGATYCNTDDGPDANNLYVSQFVAKRPDYFTTCLPWTQKGGISLPVVSGQAVVKTSASPFVSGVQNALQMLTSGAGGNPPNQVVGFNGSVALGTVTTASGALTNGLYPSNLFADLSTAAGNTINAIRLAFQTQRLLERDARGGTRYTEIIRSHFGVMSPDARLMRPEYLGGGRFPISMAPVPQTSGTGLTGGSAPLGTLAAVGTAVGRSGYSQSFTEHGYVIGLFAARNDKVYQQGLDRLWKRSTRFDFFMPVFSGLGEQAVLNSEIYCDGSANDALTFGFQERWGEYRWHRSTVTGFFNSRHATPIDFWHFAQNFGSVPLLNNAFVQDDLITTIARNLSAGALATQQQLLLDFFFEEVCARPMPMYGVPGLIDHF